MMSIRWCGARARVVVSGLAVPMSMSRYTSAESTLMISTGKVCASSTATLVLPLSVGPMRKMAGGKVFILEKTACPRKSRNRVSGYFAARRKLAKYTKRCNVVDRYPMGELLLRGNRWVYFVPFVFFVDQ